MVVPQAYQTLYPGFDVVLRQALLDKCVFAQGFTTADGVLAVLDDFLQQSVSLTELP